MKTGIELIEMERQRQLDVEQWKPDHDDEHKHGELALAAVCYALPLTARDTFLDRLWPWDKQWWKPVQATNYCGRQARQLKEIRARIRELEKAGALVAAEIDRLSRIPVGEILQCGTEAQT